MTDRQHLLPVNGVGHATAGHPLACCMKHCAHHESHDGIEPPREGRPCACEDKPRMALARQVEQRRSPLCRMGAQEHKGRDVQEDCPACSEGHRWNDQGYLERWDGSAWVASRSGKFGPLEDGEADPRFDCSYCGGLGYSINERSPDRHKCFPCDGTGRKNTDTCSRCGINFPDALSRAVDRAERAEQELVERADKPFDKGYDGGRYDERMVVARYLRSAAEGSAFGTVLRGHANMIEEGRHDVFPR